MVLLLSWWHVLFALSYVSCMVEGSWFRFTCNDYTKVSCFCELPNRSDARCSFAPSDGRRNLSCSMLKTAALASLRIHCADCGILNLSRLVYNSSLLHLEISKCQLERTEEIDPKVSRTFALIGDGSVTISGAAGFLGMSRRVSSKSSFKSSRVVRLDCKLNRLTISESDLKFPSALMFNCPDLHTVEINSTLLQDMSDEEVLAMSAARSLSIIDSGLFNFGDFLVKQTLEELNRQPITVDCATKECKKLTSRANATISTLLETHGAVTNAWKLYYLMDVNKINFRLLMGLSEASPHVASPLKNLNLSKNRLSLIPSSLSMLGNLNSLDLSWNSITSLYDTEGCWDGSASNINSKNSKTLKQCYWFRASRENLKYLNLSHNLIENLDQLEPWYQVGLWTLDLSYNRISVLDSDAFTGHLSHSLRELFLSHNNLKTVQLNCLTKIIRLTIESNALTRVSNTTLPKSSGLREISLMGNYITSIEYAFKEYMVLEKIDLRYNLLHNFQFLWFQTSPRYTKSDRVTVLLRQRPEVMPVCDCRHFYASTLREQKSDSSVYKWPAVRRDEAMSIKCLLIPKDRGQNITKTLASLKPKDFGCHFTEDSSFDLPKEICNRHGDKCQGRCNPGCYCWTNSREMVMNCSSSGIPQSAKNIPVPITSLDFSGVKRTFFQAFSNATLTWSFPNGINSLNEFHAENSNIVSIEDYAFFGMKNLTKIYISHNMIKQLTRNTFAGLENTLTTLVLDHNNLSIIRPNQVFQPLGALSRVTVGGNPFVCSCDTVHLNYLKELAEYNSKNSVIRDYNGLTCHLSDAFLDDFKRFNLLGVYKNFSVPNFPMENAGLLETICSDIADQKAQLMITIVKVSLITLGTVIGLVAIAAITRRRHFICSLVAFSLIRRVLVRKNGMVVKRRPYHLFVFCADEHTEVLENITYTLARTCKPLTGIDALVSTTSDFQVAENSVQCLTTLESIDEAVKKSSKVMVILAEELFQTKSFELTTIVNALTDRRLSRDLILMRLEDQSNVERQIRESLETIGSRQEREGLMIWMRILLSSQTVLYGSLDWQYKLINLIFTDSSGPTTMVSERDDEITRLIRSTNTLHHGYTGDSVLSNEQV